MDDNIGSFKPKTTEYVYFCPNCRGTYFYIHRQSNINDEYQCATCKKWARVVWNREIKPFKGKK